MAVTIIKSTDSDNQAIVDNTGALKVTGTFSATNASIGLNGGPAPTSSTEIAAIDPDGNLAPLLVDSNGALITIANGGFTTQDLEIFFNEVNSIAVGMETIINTFTAPVGKISYLLTIFNSGENRAQYNVYINGVLLDRQYSGLTTLNALFDYKTGVFSVPGRVVVVGDLVEVKVVNSGTSTANYNSRIMVLEAT